MNFEIIQQEQVIERSQQKIIYFSHFCVLNPSVINNLDISQLLGALQLPSWF